MSHYQVRMWLTCDKETEAVLEEFDERIFPRSLERDWSRMVIEAADLPALAGILNEKIFTRCEDAIKADFEDRNPSEGETIASRDWAPGAGGQHEGRNAVQVEVDVTGGPREEEDWVFTASDRETATVFAHTEHTRIS